MHCRFFLAISIAVSCAYTARAADNLDLSGYEELSGFVDLYWDADSGRILIDVE
jgi:hypothetical protein